jgi:hypothetical protein
VTDRNKYKIDYGAVGAAVRAKYPEWVAVYGKVEAKARELQHEPEVHRDDLQQLLVAVLYARTLATVSAAILIAEHGYDVQCRVLLRSAMEALFSLVAIVRDPAMADAFTLADERERKRMLWKTRSLSNPELRARAALHATDEQLREIEDAIEATDAKSISVEAMAKAARLHDWYLTAYAVFSGSVHGNVRDLERHLVVTDESEIEAIRNEPVIEQLDRVFLTAVEVLVQAMEALSLVFEMDTERFRVRVAEELKLLVKTIEG